jgi:hypothetical protein
MRKEQFEFLPVDRVAVEIKESPNVEIEEEQEFVTTLAVVPKMMANVDTSQSVHDAEHASAALD